MMLLLVKGVLNMIIGLVDYPGRDHNLLNEELIKQGVIVVKGTFEDVLKQNNDNVFIVWDEPMLLEKGYEKKVDKVLEIIRFGKSMTTKEYQISSNRNSLSYDCYYTAIPEQERERTEQKWLQRYKAMQTEIKEYLHQWRQEQEEVVISDREIRAIAEVLIQHSTLNIASLKLHSNVFLPSTARFLDWSNEIIINPYHVKKYPKQVVKKRLTLTVAHELGHAFDPDLPPINERIRQLEKEIREATSEGTIQTVMEELVTLTLRAENNAFDYAYQFLPNGFEKEYVEAERHKNENGYRQLLQRQKEKYLQTIQKTQA